MIVSNLFKWSNKFEKVDYSFESIREEFVRVAYKTERLNSCIPEMRFVWTASENKYQYNIETSFLQFYHYTETFCY